MQKRECTNLYDFRLRIYPLCAQYDSHLLSSLSKNAAIQQGLSIFKTNHKNHV